MNKLAFFAVMTILSASVHPQGAGGVMIVRVTGLNSDQGRVAVALTDSEKNFGQDLPFRGAFDRISGGRSEVRFESVPFGEYAVKCFHDRNSNGKLDTNFLGIPVEGYAFSNGARRTFGPPSYEEAKFEFAADGQIVELVIGYLSK